MNDSEQHRSRPFQGRSVRTWGVILGTVIVAGLAVASFGSFAGAADDNGAATGTAAPDGTARPHPQLSDDAEAVPRRSGCDAAAAAGRRHEADAADRRAARRVQGGGRGLRASRRVALVVLVGPDSAARVVITRRSPTRRSSASPIRA